MKTYDARELAARLRARAAGASQAPMQRRVFLKLTGIGGLAIACADAASGGSPAPGELPPSSTGGGSGMAGDVAPAMPPDGEPVAPPPGDPMTTEEMARMEEMTPPVSYTELTAVVHIGDDDGVTFFTPQSDMGQGVLTSLSMLLAEELEVDWARVRAKHPDVSAQGSPGWFTVASSSIPSALGLGGGPGRGQPIAIAAAAAREMLVAAAAARLSVPVGELRVELGQVVHDGSGQRLGYGELVEEAARLPVPQQPALLSGQRPARIVGTPRSQLNARAKASGLAQYTLDVFVPNMLVGLVARPPVIGGSVAAFDASAALSVEGVRDVVQIDSGVAVLADHYWAALKGREALVVEWNAGANANLSTSGLLDTMAGMLGTGNAALAEGNPDQVLAGVAAEQQLDVTYDLPYLAHAPMEPLNAVADVRADRVEIWAGSQATTQIRGMASTATGVPQDAITVHVPLLGGAFGRRANNDFVADAIQASAAVGRPVKIVFSREDDTRSANYRPINCHRLRGAVSESGLPSAWVHDIVVQGIFGGFATEGAAEPFPYALPDRRVTWAPLQVDVPVFTWRSVGASQNAFVVESFLDELAALGGRDPLEARLELLDASTAPDAARFAAALRNVAERSGWGTPAPEGRARGVAVHQTFGSIVAQVAEVSIEQGRVRVHRVWAAVDCGQAVNPLGVEAQCEGAILFGLSAALYGQIEIDAGVPQQDNFDRYRLVRMAEAPAVDVAILDSGKATTGMGEPGVPPIAPAVCNAIFALTGVRLRRLPIGDQLQGLG